MSEESKRLKTWFADRPLFKVAGMCAKIKIDKSNFHSILKGDAEIPEKIIEKILPIINMYGYSPTAWSAMEEFQKTTSLNKGLPIPKDFKEVKEVSVLKKDGTIEPVDMPLTKAEAEKIIKEIKEEKKSTLFTGKQFKIFQDRKIADIEKRIKK